MGDTVTVSHPVVQLRKLLYCALDGMEVHVTDDSINPSVAMVALHNVEAKLLALTLRYGSGMEVMVKEFGLFPGLQKVSKCGPAPYKHIGCPTAIIGPQFTW